MENFAPHRPVRRDTRDFKVLLSEFRLTWSKGWQMPRRKFPRWRSCSRNKPPARTNGKFWASCARPTSWKWGRQNFKPTLCTRTTSSARRISSSSATNSTDISVKSLFNSSGPWLKVGLEDLNWYLKSFLGSCFSLASSHTSLKTPDVAFQRGSYYYIALIFVGFSGNLPSSLGPSTLEAFCLFCRPQYPNPGTSRKTVSPVFPRIRGRNSGSSDGASLVDVQCLAGKTEFSPIPLNGDSPERELGKVTYHCYYLFIKLHEIRTAWYGNNTR